jgi:hypothetical protein
MNRSALTFAICTLALSAGISSAQAGQQCYRQVSHPAVHRTVAEHVLVTPAQTVAHTIPARQGVVRERIVVREAQTVAHTIPAEYATVSEQVMVSPAGKEWRVTRGHHGETVGCWVHVPAQYTVRHRQVTVRPASVVHKVIPAVYETRERLVEVEPARIVHKTIPAVYATRHREVQVQPASTGWQPIRGHHGDHCQTRS